MKRQNSIYCVLLTLTSGLAALAQGVHPAIASATASKAVDPAFAVDHMILSLRPSAAQQAALDTLTEQQQDPNSENFHKFLTPVQFADAFGAAQSDLDKVTAWLTANGFHIHETAASHLAIVFSGTAAQVASAFHTEIREYVINGETHHANATAPQIPPSLQSVVRGVVKLNDFHARPHSRAFAASSARSLVPADFATIYNLTPLYGNGFSGSGQGIAVVGRSNVNPQDLAAFRAAYGLPASRVTSVFAAGTDPGILGADDALEATLDAEWAGALAPKADIELVIAASTAATDGVDLAAQYSVNHNVAPILSVSFGACEAVSNNAFYSSLWQQAAAQGISVFVSAGDSGAAGCDLPAAAAGTVRAVNAICSTPYSTCVGGTLFNDVESTGAFWHPGNNPEMGSAIGYIPEQSWNESALAGGTGLMAGGGGASGIYAKPDWQTGLGVPVDGRRDVPDVSLNAAQHDGYRIYFNGASMTVSGTSAGAASFAAIQAVVNEKIGAPQGNINAVLYSLAANSSVFHDVTSGNSSVPGVAGYNAGAGYDLATGLGSVNAAQLAANWPSSAASPTCSLTAGAVSLTLVQKQSTSTTLACGSTKGQFDGDLTLSVSGLPAGVTAGFSPEATLTPGTGLKSMIMTASANAKPGTYAVLVTASGHHSAVTNAQPAFATSLSMTLTVNTPTTFNVTPSATSVSIPQGSSGSVTLTCVHSGSFNSAIAFQASGLPSTVSATFSATTIPAPGDGSTTITLQALSIATAGSYTMSVVAQGGGLVLKIPITVQITTAPAFKLTASLAVLTLREPYIPASGTPTPSTAAITLTTGTLTNGFNLPVTLIASTLPTGVTASFSPATIAAPGSGTSVLTLSIANTATTGVSTFTITGTGGTITRTVNVELIVTPPPTFSLSVTYPSYTLMAGSSMTQTISSTPLYGYSSNIQLSTTLPTGIIASLSATTIKGAYGTSMITIQPAANLAAGTYPITVTGTDATTGNVQTVQISLIVASVTTTISPSPVSVTHGTSVNATVTTTATSYTGNVVLSLTGLPAGVSSTFSPTSIVGGTGTSTLTLLASSYTSKGSYLMTLKSSAAGVIFTTVFTLTVT